MDILKRIPEDKTYTQNKGIQEFSMEKTSYFSLDLKNATDRFPVDLQERLLSQLVGKERAREYISILVDYPFEIAGGKTISYSVGQPMGAYGSWALMSLTHHLLAFTARSRAGVGNYIMLGDDSVIKTKEMAVIYIGICKQLGIEISEAKSL